MSQFTLPKRPQISEILTKLSVLLRQLFVFCVNFMVQQIDHLSMLSLDY